MQTYIMILEFHYICMCQCSIIMPHHQFKKFPLNIKLWRGGTFCCNIWLKIRDHLRMRWMRTIDIWRSRLVPFPLAMESYTVIHHKNLSLFILTLKVAKNHALIETTLNLKDIIKMQARSALLIQRENLPTYPNWDKFWLNRKHDISYGVYPTTC